MPPADPLFPALPALPAFHTTLQLPLLPRPHRIPHPYVCPPSRKRPRPTHFSTRRAVISSASHDPTPANGAPPDPTLDPAAIAASAAAAAAAASANLSSNKSSSSLTPLDSSPVIDSIISSDSSSNANDSNLDTQPDPNTQPPNPVVSLFSRVFAWIRRAFAPAGFIWGLAAGVIITAALILAPNPLAPRDALLREKVTLFNFILHDISASYVDAVDINRLFETGVNSMLGTLDPYTQFENNAQALEMAVKTNGRYAGVGLGISLGDPPTSSAPRPIVVLSAFEGYAFDAGLRPGDVIETVAGEDVSGVSLEKVTDMLRGEPGTVVDVTVSRQGAPSPLSFQLPRRSVHIKDVPAATLVGDPRDRIGYIRLQSFAKDAASEVAAALTTLDKDSGGLQGLVLDLRGNPGGLLNAAIEVAEVLLPKGSTIVSTKGRGLGPAPIYVSSKDPTRSPDMPLAVLVNGQTASASEIVAGALQDLDYGVIIGAKTFGKGLVQNVQELPFKTALKYTVGKYYTPSGRCIQALNYEQAERDGPFETKKVEENERHEFQTRSGRIVRDGGGIEPDVDVQKRPSFLELALQRQFMYFNFATKYGAESKMEKLPSDFEVTDAMYRDFVKYVTTSDFKYESRFDEAFDQLDEMFKDVGYEAARSKVNDLKRVTSSEMKSDFIRHEKDIRVQLESAIRYRFQPDSERIVAELKYDDQLTEALRVLKDKDEYIHLLSPSMLTDTKVASTDSDNVSKG